MAAGDVLEKVVNRGVIRVGNPTGEIYVQARNFEQTSTGELICTLSAAGAGRLRLREGATLAGALTIELADGFSPAVGTAFTVLQASGRTGEFDTVHLPAPGAGRRFEVSYGTSAVVVRVFAQ